MGEVKDVALEESAQTRVVRDTYCDSLKLLVATGTMSSIEGVDWAGAVMGTSTGIDRLGEAGVRLTEAVGANDLVLAVVSADPLAASSALDAGVEAVFDRARLPDEAPTGRPTSCRARSTSCWRWR